MRSLLAQVIFEPADEREQRLRLVRRFAFRAYRAVCRHLGEEQARKLFAGFISPPLRDKRPRGPHDARRARELAEEHGRLAAKATTSAERAKLPRRVAKSRVRGLRTPRRLTRSFCGDFCVNKSARQPYFWPAVIVSVAV